MNSIIITTTNGIEGCPVLNYLDFVCANIVIGTNIFSDISASFTDFFGGFSTTYQNKLEIIQKEAIKSVKAKASILGANAIISFRVDFDEISGTGKSMFMVSASGTACIIDKKNIVKTSTRTNEVPKSTINRELKKEYIIKKVNESYRIQEEWADFLIEYPQDELCNKLLKAVIKYYKDSSEKDYLNQTIRILSRITRDVLIDAVYSELKEHPEPMALLMIVIDLFSPTKILELCKNKETKLVLFILDCEAPYYTKEDIDSMKLISDYFDNLPDTGSMELIKGLLGKETKKYVCENGHKNNPDYKFCEVLSCGMNIKGLDRNDLEKIAKFKDKIRILENILSK